MQTVINLNDWRLALRTDRLTFNHWRQYHLYHSSSQNDKYFPNTNERPCYIEGIPEDIVKAIQTIQEKLANDNPRRG